MDDFATGYLAGQDGGNNNGGFFGNEGLWAVIILAIIFGWGTNGYGRNGGDNGMNSYIPYLVGTGATGQGGADTRAALSEGFYQQDTSRSLAGIQSGICSLGYDQLAQMNGVNANIANGFAGVNSAIRMFVLSHLSCLLCNTQNTFKIIIYINNIAHTLMVVLIVPTFKKNNKLFHIVNPPKNPLDSELDLQFVLYIF